MINPEYQKLLGELKNTNYGKALIALLDEELEKIDTIRGVKTLDETLGRQLAVDIIEKVFAFLDRPKAKGDKAKTTYT